MGDRDDGETARSGRLSTMLRKSFRRDSKDYSCHILFRLCV